jgi:anti-sigma B factor antagonist
MIHEICRDDEAGRMAMKISQSSENAVAVLDLEGNLTVGDADTEFSETIERLLDRGTASIVVDLAKVEMVDSTGLGSLVRSHHRCVQAGGSLRLVNLRFQVWELFQTARLVGIIPIFDDMQRALDG